MESLRRDFFGVRHNLGVSPDGMVVDFGFEEWGKRRARFDVAALMLGEPRNDGRTLAPRQEALPVENWEDSPAPTLGGTRLPLEPYEWSRGLAIHPDGARFVLVADYTLRAFDVAGSELWRRAVPGAVWAVSIAAERDLVVAAHADGTIRWHRLDDGAELLAFFPFNNGEDWIARDPEGRLAGTIRARRSLSRLANRGWDEVPRLFRAGEIRKSHRPGVIRRVLPLMGTTTAIHAAENADRASDSRAPVGGLVPGAR